MDIRDLPLSTEDSFYLLEPKERMDRLQKMAADHARVIVVAKATQLLLDLDSKESLDHFKTYIKLLGQYLCPMDWGIFPSKSGNHHAVVWLRREMSIRERIAYQAALGSDPCREALSLARVEEHYPDPIVLLMHPAGAQYASFFNYDNYNKHR